MEYTLATFKIILDTRRAYQSGLYPVKLRLTFKRKTKYIGLDMKMSKDDFQLVMDTRKKGKYLFFRRKIKELENKADSILKDMHVFSFDAFQEYWNADYASYTSIFKYFDSRIKEYRQNGQIKTAETLEQSKREFQRFSRKKDLQFADITPTWLKAFERYQLEKDNSYGTISLRLRDLRKVFNYAGMRDKHYPFNQYKIPSTPANKKALKYPEKIALMQYKPEKGAEAWAIDLLKFIFYANGINPKDLFQLRHNNVKGDFIEYNRSKTSHKRDKTPIKVFINDEMRVIMKRHKGKGYLFKGLEKAKTAQEIEDKCNYLRKKINKYGKRVSEKLDFHRPITVSVMRDTFASWLKWKGISTERIGEAMGHSSKQITENYLAGFTDEKLIELSRILSENQ